MSWRRRAIKQRGFTLVELLIAMVVLAIGILATMAMQFSALAGYTSASELTAANDLARTVEQMIWLEARGLQSGDNLNEVSSPFSGGEPDFLAAMEADGGGWTAATPNPVAYGMSAAGVPRYCVYVAGDQLPVASGSGVDPDEDFFRAAIAVVYPRSRRGFDGDCDDVVTEVGGNDPDHANLLDYEAAGYRIVHLTTAVRARSDG